MISVGDDMSFLSQWISPDCRLNILVGRKNLADCPESAAE